MVRLSCAPRTTWVDSTRIHHIVGTIVTIGVMAERERNHAWPEKLLVLPRPHRRGNSRHRTDERRGKYRLPAIID